MKLEFSRQILEKYSNITFHEILFSGNPVVPCGWTDVTKLIVSFHNFANGLKIGKTKYFASHKILSVTDTIPYHWMQVGMPPSNSLFLEQ
jgi:hypothetical protein